MIEGVCQRLPGNQTEESIRAVSDVSYRKRDNYRPHGKMRRLVEMRRVYSQASVSRVDHV